jgi:hypothetical protein
MFAVTKIYEDAEIKAVISANWRVAPQDEIWSDAGAGIPLGVAVLVLLLVAFFLGFFHLLAMANAISWHHRRKSQNYQGLSASAKLPQRGFEGTKT